MLSLTEDQATLINGFITTYNDDIFKVYEKLGGEVELLPLQVVPHVSFDQAISCITIGHWNTGTAITAGTDKLLSARGNGCYKAVDGLFGRNNTVFEDLCPFHEKYSKSLQIPKKPVLHSGMFALNKFLLNMLTAISVPLLALHPYVGWLLVQWFDLESTGEKIHQDHNVPQTCVWQRPREGRPPLTVVIFGEHITTILSCVRADQFRAEFMTGLKQCFTEDNGLAGVWICSGEFTDYCLKEVVFKTHGGMSGGALEGKSVSNCTFIIAY
jgi:hypothetical protein